MFKVCCHSVYIAQKSCFRLGQKKNPPSYFVNVQVQFFPVGEENVYQSRASKFFSEKGHSSEFFNKKRQFREKICEIFSVISSEMWNYYYTLSCIMWW